MQNLNSFFVHSNKIVVIFLIKFFGTYALFFLIYNSYLSHNQKTDSIFSCAPITKSVAKQAKGVLNFAGFKAEIEQHTEEVSMKLIINNKYVARVIEGCNAISIIILFISFIVAFANKFKATLLFILGGSLIIYFTNILRISIIAIALYKYPAYEKILHNIIFPSIIYGITFLLWFIWVRKFSIKKK